MPIKDTQKVGRHEESTFEWTEIIREFELKQQKMYTETLPCL